MSQEERELLWLSMSLKNLIFIILLGCKYAYSPYEVGTQKLHQNSISLKQIAVQESQLTSDYKIALISDTHNYYEDLHDLINTINKNGPYAFVIVTGDITNQGLLEEFAKTKEYLNGLWSPYLVVPGNHDLLSNGNKVFANYFGETDFSLVHKDVEYFFFNNNNWESGGTIPDMTSIESKLRASASPLKFLIAHISPDDPKRFTQEQVSQWLEFVNTYKVDYFIHGHNHSPLISTFGEAIKITIGAPSKRAYFELIFNAGGVTHKQIDF
jgi:3',5'-cyclic-AMP phosphodiesterase